MKKIFKKLKKNRNEFMECAEINNADVGVFQYIQFVFYYKKYAVSMNDYFSNKLYDKSISHKEFWAVNHRIIHKWKNVVKKYKPESSWIWRALHFCDYAVCKIFYPGIDAMDYFRYEFYNIKRSKRKTFITEGYLRRMNTIFNNEKKHMDEFRLLQDKAKFNEFFSDVVTRKWIKTKGMSRCDFETFCQGLEQVIAKPEDGSQGKGIYITSVSSEQDRETLFNELNSQNYLLEELVVQCEEIARINPRSVNSIRVNSVLTGRGVVITAATLRLGNGCSDTDNYSAGGFAASIDVDTGIVISRAVSQNAGAVYVHPFTGQKIIGAQIPQWEDVMETVKRSHQKIPNLRYIGWDVVVCNDGTVTFLEANTFSGVELQQHPLLEGKKPLYASLMRQ